MRAVVQRVLRASVSVDGKILSQIERGLCVLVGIHANDTDKDLDFIAKKIIALRLFESKDGSKGWSTSVHDNNLDILLVSQFTLYAKLKGNKPDFHESMAPALSKGFYARFVERVRALHAPNNVLDGEFGGYMLVDLVNDGPVTIDLNSDSAFFLSSTPSQRARHVYHSSSLATLVV
jgi:D-tyrosyl-tRNA(Tyr) deacylase